MFHVLLRRDRDVRLAVTKVPASRRRQPAKSRPFFEVLESRNLLCLSGIPIPDYPGQGEIIDIQRPTFLWHPGGGELPDHYIWSVLWGSEEHPTYVGEEYDFNVRETFKTSGFLPPDADLRWKVESVDRNGCRSGAARGVGYHFRIDVGVTCAQFVNQAPAKVGPGTPDRNNPEVITQNPPTFQWYFFNGAQVQTIYVQDVDPPPYVRPFGGVPQDYPDDSGILSYTPDSIFSLPTDRELRWKMRGVFAIWNEEPPGPGECDSAYETDTEPQNLYFIIRTGGAAHPSGATIALATARVDPGHGTSDPNATHFAWTQNSYQEQQLTRVDTAFATDFLGAPRPEMNSRALLQDGGLPMPSEGPAPSTVASLRSVEPLVSRWPAFPHNGSIWDDVDRWLAI